MAESASRKAREHHSDYDGAWKETLRQHFALVVSKYFPSLAAEIDWSTEPEWFDKELSQILQGIMRMRCERYSG